MCPFSKSCPYPGEEPSRKILAEGNYLRQRVKQMKNVPGYGQKEIPKASLCPGAKAVASFKS